MGIKTADSTGVFAGACSSLATETVVREGAAAWLRSRSDGGQNRNAGQHGDASNDDQFGFHSLITDQLKLIPRIDGGQPMFGNSYWLVTAGARSSGRVRRTIPAWPVFGATTSSLPWCRSRILWLTISPNPSPTLRVV